MTLKIETSFFDTKKPHVAIAGPVFDFIPRVRVSKQEVSNPLLDTDN